MVARFRASAVILILLWSLGTVHGNDKKITPTTSTTDLNARYFSPRTFKSKIILWKARCQRERNQKKLYKETRLFTRPTKQGTFLTFQKPTQERISGWFWGTDHIQFNHPFVGLTNPFLNVDNGNKAFDLPTLEVSSSNPISNSNRHLTKETKMVSRRGAENGVLSEKSIGDHPNLRNSSSSCWWPDGPWKGILSRQKKSSSWRVLCYRKRVGYGRECYERVKQSALANDFDDGGRKGIISVVPPRTKSITPYHRFAQPGLYSEIYATSTSNNAQALWPGGGRRLATFARSGPFSWLRIFAVNPVSVVYEMEDQRMEDPTGARGGCLYTSTAFATCRGHWLAGEERVTVALRDDDCNQPERGAPVDVEILSLSRPAPSLVGKIAWPLIGRMQNTFFVQQLNALEKVATSPHLMPALRR